MVNPSLEQLKRADIDIMVGASKDSVVMVEGEMSEISEREMLDAIEFAHAEIKKQIELLKKDPNKKQELEQSINELLIYQNQIKQIEFDSIKGR